MFLDTQMPRTTFDLRNQNSETEGQLHFLVDFEMNQSLENTHLRGIPKLLRLQACSSGAVFFSPTLSFSSLLFSLSSPLLSPLPSPLFLSPPLLSF